MTVQRSVAVRNAGLDSAEVTIGVSARFNIFAGAPPANCAAADSGSLLSTIVLPSDWMSNAAAGVKALLGTWAGTGAASGVAGHYRIKDSTNTTTHEQGTITATGGGGDATMDNTNIAVSQALTVNTFAWTAGNP